MKSDDIPDTVRRFVLTSIPSVPFLEALLLLQGLPDTRWDAPALARRLYLSERASADLLEELHAAGFAGMEEPDIYHYAPRSDDIKELIVTLRQVYARNLVGVSNLIHSKTHRKAQQFADAFKLRKDS
jgi:hypothetical protein